MKNRAALLFTGAYFPLRNKSFRKILTLSQGSKPAQPDDWQQQIVAVRGRLRSNDKICLSFLAQSVCPSSAACGDVLQLQVMEHNTKKKKKILFSTHDELWKYPGSLTATIRWTAVSGESSISEASFVCFSMLPNSQTQKFFWKCVDISKTVGNIE